MRTYLLSLVILMGSIFALMAPAQATEQLFLPDCKGLIKATVIQSERPACLPVTDHGPRFQVRR